MADTPTPTSSPAVGRRRFLATAAGATAALLVTDRIPGAWAVPGPPPTTPSPRRRLRRPDPDRGGALDPPGATAA
jgi:hypothetical protein